MGIEANIINDLLPNQNQQDKNLTYHNLMELIQEHVVWTF